MRVGRRDQLRKVNWLIRHLINEVSQQWNQNVLFAHRQQYRTPTFHEEHGALQTALRAPWVLVTSCTQRWESILLTLASGLVAVGA